jgi:hypothetical protein
MALLAAARNGDMQTVMDLVARGEDVHAEDDEALHMAALNGHLAVVEYLVDHGADIHARNERALRCAAEDGHLAVVQYLVARGADIHAEDDYALRWAAQDGHLAVVQYLVDHGANIHAENDKAMRWAACNGHLAVVQYLLDHTYWTLPHLVTLRQCVKPLFAAKPVWWCRVRCADDTALPPEAQVVRYRWQRNLRVWYAHAMARAWRMPDGSAPFPTDRAMVPQWLATAGSLYALCWQKL